MHTCLSSLVYKNIYNVYCGLLNKKKRKWCEDAFNNKQNIVKFYNLK